MQNYEKIFIKFMNRDDVVGIQAFNSIRQNFMENANEKKNADN